MVNATLSLYKDIGLDPGFTRTMLFDSKSQQSNWFSSKSHSTISANYNKLQNAFTYPISELDVDPYTITYVRVQNMDYTERDYYGFVADVTLIDTETMRFSIVIDPIQTFMCEWELGQCAVYREHCDRWGNTNSLPIRVSPSKESAVSYANVITSKNIAQKMNGASKQIATCVFAFTADYEMAKSDGSDKETKNLLKFAVIPISVDGTRISTTFQFNLKDNNHVQETIVNPSFDEIISGSYFDYWNINPESIFGIWIFPVFGIDFWTTTGTSGAYGSEIVEQDVVGETVGSGVYDKDKPITARVLATATANDTSVVQILTESQMENALAFNTRSYVDTEELLFPTKPTSAINLKAERYEPQMFMAPYTNRYITDYFGTVIMTIPDVIAMSNPELSIYISTMVKSTGPSVTLRLGQEYDVGVVGGTTMIPAYAVDMKSDAWKSYCLTQRDSDRRNMWNNIVANTINQAFFMGYGGALVGSRSNSGKNDPAKNPDAKPVPGYGTAMIKATGLGVGASLVTSAVQGWQMWEQQENKEQAIRNEPSTLTAMSDGSIAGRKPLRFIETRCDNVTFERALSNFQNYGYIVNTVETPNIKSRYYFNYICTTNTVIKGALSADIKQDIISIFEKGITFFHADHCSTTDYPEYENIERSLL